MTAPASSSSNSGGRDERPFEDRDVTPWPVDVPFDRAKIAVAKSMRGRSAKVAKFTSTNAIIAHARRTIADSEARAALAAQPVERATTFLRRKGFAPVFNRANVLGPPHRGYQVGRATLADAAELLAFARKRGWTEKVSKNRRGNL